MVSYFGSSRDNNPSKKSRRRAGDDEISRSSLGSNRTTGSVSSYSEIGEFFNLLGLYD